MAVKLLSIKPHRTAWMRERGRGGATVSQKVALPADAPFLMMLLPTDIPYFLQLGGQGAL